MWIELRRRPDSYRQSKYFGLVESIYISTKIITRSLNNTTAIPIVGNLVQVEIENFSLGKFPFEAIGLPSL